jgi:hypothetical protein
MWTGTLGEFAALLRLVERQYEPLIPAFVKSETKYQRDRVAYAKASLAATEQQLADSDDRTRARYEERANQERETVREATRKLESETAAAKNAAQIDVTLERRGRDRRNVTGTADEVADYLEGKEFRSAEFSTPSGLLRGHRISISTERFDGLTLHVSSDDGRWSTAAFVELSDEIRKHVPRGRFLRSLWLLVPLFIASIGFSLWLLRDAFVVANGITDSTTQSGLTTAWFFAALIVGYAGALLAWIAVPAVEFVAAGRRSRGGRLLAVVGSVIATIILGIVVNLLTK